MILLLTTSKNIYDFTFDTLKKIFIYFYTVLKNIHYFVL